jgi:hypothetical protein
VRKRRKREKNIRESLLLKSQDKKNKNKNHKLDEKDKEVDDSLNALGTPTVSPVKITNEKWDIQE